MEMNKEKLEERERKQEKKKEKEKWEITRNKYRGGTSDATTSSSLIVPLILMSFDNFLPSKMAIFVIRK